MTLSSVELRFLLAQSRALLPPASGRPDQPCAADVDLAAFWAEFFRTAPPLAALGMRAGLWLLELAPPLLLGRARPFHRLAAEEQDRCLARANAHPLYLVRQTVLALKTFVCLACFRDARFRGHFALDRRLQEARR